MKRLDEARKEKLENKLYKSKDDRLLKSNNGELDTFSRFSDTVDYETSQL